MSPFSSRWIFCSLLKTIFFFVASPSVQGERRRSMVEDGPVKIFYTDDVSADSAPRDSKVTCCSKRKKNTRARILHRTSPKQAQHATQGSAMKKNRLTGGTGWMGSMAAIFTAAAVIAPPVYAGLIEVVLDGISRNSAYTGGEARDRYANQDAGVVPDADLTWRLEYSYNVDDALGTNFSPIQLDLFVEGEGNILSTSEFAVGFVSRPGQGVAAPPSEQFVPDVYPIDWYGYKVVACTGALSTNADSCISDVGDLALSFIVRSFDGSEPFGESFLMPPTTALIQGMQKPNATIDPVTGDATAVPSAAELAGTWDNALQVWTYRSTALEPFNVFAGTIERPGVAVPEPDSLWLALIGLMPVGVALAARRRRREKPDTGIPGT